MIIQAAGADTICPSQAPPETYCFQTDILQEDGLSVSGLTRDLLYEEVFQDAVATQQPAPETDNIQDKEIDIGKERNIRPFQERETFTDSTQLSTEHEAVQEADTDSVTPVYDSMPTISLQQTQKSVDTIPELSLPEGKNYFHGDTPQELLSMGSLTNENLLSTSGSLHAKGLFDNDSLANGSLTSDTRANLSITHTNVILADGSFMTLEEKPNIQKLAQPDVGTQESLPPSSQEPAPDFNMSDPTSLINRAINPTLTIRSESGMSPTSCTHGQSTLTPGALASGAQPEATSFDANYSYLLRLSDNGNTRLIVNTESIGVIDARIVHQDQSINLALACEQESLDLLRQNKEGFREAISSDAASFQQVDVSVSEHQQQFRHKQPAMIDYSPVDRLVANEPTTDKWPLMTRIIDTFA